MELQFEDGSGIAFTDRMRNAYVKLNPVNKGGMDALDLDYKWLKKVLNAKVKIKDMLIDQDIIRGVGNG